MVQRARIIASSLFGHLGAASALCYWSLALQLNAPRASQGSVVQLSDTAAVGNSKGGFYALEDGVVLLTGCQTQQGGPGVATFSDSGGCIMGAPVSVVSSWTP